jgi:hypothetical protein
MKPTIPMTPRERRDRDAAILAAYVREIKRYRAEWQVPPDKRVHMATWAAARRAVGSTTEGRAVP